MGKGSWRAMRLAFLMLFCAVTVTAYLMPLLPLRLPLCLFKLVTGYPCAGCGLTRSVIAAAHGHFGESFCWHPVGLLLFWVMGAVGLAMTYELLTGRVLPWGMWLQRYGALLGWSLLAAFAALWLLRLSYYRFGQWLPIPLKVPL